MSAEFIPVMSDNSGMSYTFEHDVTRNVVGDVESLRARLADALEQMGYRVLNEQPLQARRSAKGSACSGCASDIRDYQTTLNIGLKSTGANSTRVTFDYTVKGVYIGYLSKGDRNTLTREAEALVAQAMARTASAHCAGCGADTVGSSRFCRQCGAPLTPATPPEMEVLRLTANANTSYNQMTGGGFFILLAAALLLVLLFGSDDPIRHAKLLRIITVISSALGAAGLVMVLMGLARLRNLLQRPIERDSPPQVSRRGSLEGIGAPDTNELPPASIGQSVTEKTTDLLPHEVEQAR